MKVKISERAKYNRNKIADYILRKFGEKALLDFREEYKRTNDARLIGGCYAVCRTETSVL